MIFSIQRYLEDYFNRRGFIDNDQYAVNIANVYALNRSRKSNEELLSIFSRVNTFFYRNNTSIRRGELEHKLLTLLDKNFKKKLLKQIVSFPAV